MGIRRAVIPDQVFVNGHVITMDSRETVATAFSVAHGRFLSIGSDTEILDQASAETRIVDLGGLTVTPGFIESHSHLSLYAMTLLQADCRTPPSLTIEDIRTVLRQTAADVAPGQWVRGWGYDDTLICEKRHLTREDLDAAAPYHPVFVSHASGHLAYVNSLALKMSGIDRHTVQPEGGKIHSGPDGNPSGLLKENGALSLITRHIPLLSAEQLKPVMRQAMSEFHRAGITSIHDAAIGYFKHHRPILKAYQELEAAGELRLRVYLTVVEEVYRRLFEAGLRTGFGSPLLKFGAVKLFQDGSIQAHTAALSEPYLDDPETRGHLLLPQETLDRLVREYHQEGVQVAIHANGDRAIESVLKAFEAAAELSSGNDARFMLIHCQLATKDQLRRMRRIGVIPSFFANHIYFWGDRHVGLFLGPERARRIDPVRSAVEEGLTFTLHSDLPITPVDPLFSIHCAVNRQMKDGSVLGPKERINVLDALRAYTTHAARCSFEEDIKGSIEPGKLADFAVLSDNPLSAPSDSIKDITVLATYLNGDCVYGN